MASFLSENEKNEIASLLDGVHDTFKRPVYFISEKDIVTLSSDGQFNYAYGASQENVVSTTQINSGVFEARIFYYDPIQTRNFNAYKNYPAPDIPLDMAVLHARLKVDASGYALLKDTKQVILDDKKFQVISATKPIGPFAISYFMVNLVELK